LTLLLDTHALLWWLLGDERLPVSVRGRIDEQAETVFASAVSAMEIATKFRIGKLPEARRIAGRLAEIAPANGMTLLDITVAHGDLAGSLAIPHRDPFDRLLIAQAQIEDAWLVSNEEPFDHFGVRRFW
jgi:PIN domain nuclease of toxin-antitoxin system